MITMAIKSDQTGPEMDREVSYKLWRTNAPADYDSGRTLQLYEGAGERIVLIDVEQEEWHRCRYASGLFWMRAEDDIDEYVIGVLVTRLHRAGE